MAINFLPWREQRRRKHLLNLFGILMMTCSMHALVYVYVWHKTHQQLLRTYASQNSLQAAIKAHPISRAKIGAISDSKDQLLWQMVLHVTHTLPSTLQLTQLTWQDHKMFIAGVVVGNTENDLFSWIKILRLLGCVQIRDKSFHAMQELFQLSIDGNQLQNNDDEILCSKG